MCSVRTNKKAAMQCVLLELTFGISWQTTSCILIGIHDLISISIASVTFSWECRVGSNRICMWHVCTACQTLEGSHTTPSWRVSWLYRCCCPGRQTESDHDVTETPAEQGNKPWPLSWHLGYPIHSQLPAAILKLPFCSGSSWDRVIFLFCCCFFVVCFFSQPPFSVAVFTSEPFLWWTPAKVLVV